MPGDAVVREGGRGALEPASEPKLDPLPGRVALGQAGAGVTVCGGAVTFRARSAAGCSIAPELRRCRPSTDVSANGFEDGRTRQNLRR